MKGIKSGSGVCEGFTAPLLNLGAFMEGDIRVLLGIFRMSILFYPPNIYLTYTANMTKLSQTFMTNVQIFKFKVNPPIDTGFIGGQISIVL